jgi:hypothetical protein
MFSQKNTIFGECLKSTQAAHMSRKSEQDGKTPLDGLCVRKDLNEFIQQLCERGAKLGVWSSAMSSKTRKDASKLSQGFNQRENADKKDLFVITFCRIECASEDGQCLGKKSKFAGPPIKNLELIWQKYPTFGPHNTILITSSIHEASLHPRNTILIPRFGISQVDVDLAFRVLGSHIKRFTQLNNPNRATTAQELCEKISLEAGFAFPNYSVFSRKQLVEFLKEASDELLNELLSPPRFISLGIDIEKNDVLNLWNQTHNRDALVKAFESEIKDDFIFFHQARTFIFNIAYLRFLEATGKQVLPEIAKKKIESYNDSIFLIYSLKKQLGDTKGGKSNHEKQPGDNVDESLATSNLHLKVLADDIDYIEPPKDASTTNSTISSHNLDAV